jgi:acyl dehydratase
VNVLTADEVTAGQTVPELVVEITPRVVIMGASSSRDWQPQHHDHAWAVSKVGPRGIFLNTPNQAGWIERYLTQWAGPKARLGKLRFRMRRPVCPGDELHFNATVTAVSDDGWVDLEALLTVGEELVTKCTARLRLPTSDDDNPWSRSGDDWRP